MTHKQIYVKILSMTWIGKLIGFLVGALIFGPVGALLGIFFGHMYDKSRSGGPSVHAIHTEAQQAFFDTTFSVMGHIAKADGHVSEDEIKVARSIMQRIGLNESQKRKAIHEFTRGKNSAFNLEANVNFLLRMCPKHRNLMKMFLDIQVQAAYANGSASQKQQHILQTICNLLNMPALNFTLLNMLYGHGQQQGYQQNYQQHYQQQHTFNQQPTKNSLSECYALLEITEKASNPEVKKAYRRMMSQNHPDKLVAKGLPEEMVKLATEKTQTIQKAYEQIQKARGIK